MTATPTDTVTAAIYIRVSSEEQAREGKVSLGVQREKAEKCCELHGWEVAEVYKDAGVSGAKADRPALTRLLGDAAEGRFQRVVFFKLDRFARSLRDLLNISHRLEESGVGIVSVQENFDTATSMGRFVVSLLGAVAELERETIAERTAMGRLGAAKKGRYVAGPAPYGYDYDGVAKTLRVNDAEAAVVRRVFRQYIDGGLSQGSIADKLNTEGVPTKTDRVRSQDGKKKGWMRTHIARILANPLYRGMAYYNRSNGRNGKKERDEWVEIPVPAIVGEDEFAAVQRRAKRNKRESQRPRDKASEYLLVGLIRCQSCGRAMATNTNRIRQGKRRYAYRYYLCTGQNNYGTPCRPAMRVRAEAIEDTVLRVLAETFSDPDKVLLAIDADAKQRQGEREEQDAVAEMLHRNLDAADNERDRYITLFGKEKITEADLEKRLAALEGDKEKWREELARIEERRQQTVVLREIAASAHAIAEMIEGIMEEMTLEEKKKLVRLLVERVWVDGENNLTIDCVVPNLIPDGRTEGTKAF